MTNISNIEIPNHIRYIRIFSIFLLIASIWVLWYTTSKKLNTAPSLFSGYFLLIMITHFIIIFIYLFHHRFNPERILHKYYMCFSMSRHQLILQEFKLFLFTFPELWLSCLLIYITFIAPNSIFLLYIAIFQLVFLVFSIIIFRNIINIKNRGVYIFQAYTLFFQFVFMSWALDSDNLAISLYVICLPSSILTIPYILYKSCQCNYGIYIGVALSLTFIVLFYLLSRFSLKKWL
ncbi:hypothetical protein SAMN04488541_103837 [Thermoflexibacter ruber]|uniref:Uncharacterized protein n=1 Tax=Thermoflexibacter ruber TaxID=1003 RepID=A0A1I2J1F7_9BACT|nr:hypothetical protein SAMN04488541_103837 [Thermoflexibacter ruber]